MATEYDERVTAVYDELAELLNPQGAKEYRIVEWLGNWDLSTLEPLRDMVTRAKRAAWAEGHETDEHGDRNCECPNPYRAADPIREGA